jgi:hypothetical protein
VYLAGVGVIDDSVIACGDIIGVAGIIACVVVDGAVVVAVAGVVAVIVDGVAVAVDMLMRIKICTH